jgi:hypothetical protein
VQTDFSKTVLYQICEMCSAVHVLLHANRRTDTTKETGGLWRISLGKRQNPRTVKHNAGANSLPLQNQDVIALQIFVCCFLYEDLLGCDTKNGLEERVLLPSSEGERPGYRLLLLGRASVQRLLFIIIKFLLRKNCDASNPACLSYQ